MVTAEKQGVISRKNPGLNPEQKDDIFDIINFLSDTPTKPKM